MSLSAFNTFNHLSLVREWKQFSILLYYCSIALTNCHNLSAKTTHIYELTFVGQPGQKSRWAQVVFCLGTQRAKIGVTQAVSLSGGSGKEGICFQTPGWEGIQFLGLKSLLAVSW